MSPSLEPSDQQRDMAAFWLARRTGGKLSASEQIEFDAWLNQDRLNRFAWDEMRVLWAHLEEPSERVARLSPPRGSVARNFTSVRGWMTVAGGGLAATIAVWIFDPNFIQNMQADIVSGREYVTPLTLPDGTVVQMGADTAISFHIDQNQRHVQLLRGEAFFEVVPGSEPDFKIDVNGDTIRVIGTRFNVDHVSDATTVSVSEGIVSVKGARDEAADRLLAGEQIRVSSGSAGKVEPADINDTMTWMSGRLVVNQANVSDVISTLSRHSSKKFYLRGSFEGKTISGSFSLTDIDGSVDTLAAALNARVVRSLPFVTLIF